MLDRSHQDDVSSEAQAQGEASSKSHTGSNASNNRLLEGLRSKTTWLRLLFTVLFLAIWAISRLIFATVVTVQVGFLLLGGAANVRLVTFGQCFAVYSRQLVAYLTFATDDKPFPLGDWPVSETMQPDSSTSESAIIDEESDGDQPDPISDDPGPSTPDSTESEATDTHDQDDTTSSQNGDNNEEPDVGNGLAETKRNKEPRRIGGRRTTLSGTVSQEQRQPTIFPPEIVCRQDHTSPHWTVMLSVDERTQAQEVRQNGESLKEESGYHRLPSFSDQLTVIYANGRKINVAFFEDKPLIFKLSRHWKGIGRMVSGITSGHYIVIAPEQWERKGHVPVTPDGCSDSRFMAHYFHRDKITSSDIGGFQRYEFSLLKSGYELIGKRVFDDSEGGDLFVGTVPTLRTPQQVSHARTGSEDENGWRGENFRPDEQALSEILNNRQGRFFIRIYDKNVELLDSGEFRYLRDLNEIRIDGEPYTNDTILLPASSGYVPVTVGFVGANGANIRPTLPPDLNQVTLQGSELIVNPHPDANKIACMLRSESGCVNIVIDLPFVWWRMESDGDGPDGWRDKPLVMSRQEFRDHAFGEAAVRLRLNPRIKSVRVGFNDESGQSYRRDANNRDLLIPLVDFVDYSQIDKRLNEDASLTVACDSAMFTLIRVSADPIPEIVSFLSEPDIVRVGERATLSWVTRNAYVDGVRIEPEIGAVESNGSIELALVRTTTYTLQVTTPDVNDVTKDTTVRVRPLDPPVIIDPLPQHPVSRTVEFPEPTFQKLMELPKITKPTNTIHAQQMSFQEFLDLRLDTPIRLRVCNIEVTGKVRTFEPYGGPPARWVHLNKRFTGSRTRRQQRERVPISISESDFENYAISIDPDGR